MSNESIDSIYAENRSIRERFFQIINSIQDDELHAAPDGEKWPIAHLVEHVAIVEEGISKICSKLLREAEAAGAMANGTSRLSENFLSRASDTSAKLEAPDRVRPTGEKSVAESLGRMEDNRKKLEELRPMFEAWDSESFKFPHPHFGDMSAIEWLSLIGGHEERHLRQIERLLEQIRK
jgi:uncharacterized damage-inducible protein DinB